MSQFIQLGSFKPVNLDHIITIEVSGNDIIFYPAVNAPSIVWSLYNSRDVQRVYKEIMMSRSEIINSNNLEGNYH